MAYQQGGQCFETVDAAAAFAGAHAHGVVIGSAGGPVAVTFQGFQGGALQFTLTSQAGVSSMQVPYQPVPCQLIDTADALALSWLVVGAWAAAFAVRLAVRAVDQ